MKKLFIITFSTIIVISLIITGVFYLLSLRTVTFSLENTSSITVYNSKDKEMASLSSNGDIKLQDGKYYVIPSGEGVATDKINFTVEGEDKTISINPPLTRDHLEKMLEKELPTIKVVISKKYGSLVDDYTLDNGSLYHHGEWFGGLLKLKVNDLRNLTDSYRIVLHKEDGEWTVIHRPEYILTSSRYSEVPVDILKDINSKA